MIFILPSKGPKRAFYSQKFAMVNSQKFAMEFPKVCNGIPKSLQSLHGQDNGVNGLSLLTRGVSFDVSVGGKII